MQRRAAAGYVTLFLVLAAGAYGVIAVSAAPTATVEDPDYRLVEGDTLTLDGRTYTVQSVTVETEDDDHGGSSVVHAATLARTNDSARYTETWPAGDTTDLDRTFQGARLNGTYSVLVPNVSEPTEATLRAMPDNLATTERDGVTYVEIEQEDGSVRQVPIDQYDDLQRVTVTEGTVDDRGNETTVEVTADGVTLSWTAPRTETVDLAQTQNVTLGGQRYFTFFPSDDPDAASPEVLLTTDAADYRDQLAQAQRHHERTNGLWGIALVSVVAAVLLVVLAFLPRKDV